MDKGKRINIKTDVYGWKMNNSSFTAASTLPVKLLMNEEIVCDIKNHNIKPYHIQLNPTNKCPLNCSFCSCKNRDKAAMMPLETMKNLLYNFKNMGTKAVTITGGGDPLAYPYLREMLEYITNNNMTVGLVTNGILFNSIDQNILKMLTWCRVSVSDEQLLANKVMDKVVKQSLDWSFSYVLNTGDNYSNLINCIEYANLNNFTHVRLVDNILTGESKIEQIKNLLQEKGIDDKLVIYQGRKTYSKGNKRCFISLLKPNIDPNSNMLPCCGIQYAFKTPAYDFDNNAIMNKINSIETIYANQLFFDGSNCVKCYYSDYNDIMGILWDSKDIKHKEFI